MAKIASPIDLLQDKEAQAERDESVDDSEYPDELIDFWVRREQRLFEGVPTTKIPYDLRHKMLACFKHAVNIMELPSEYATKAVTLVELLHSRLDLNTAVPNVADTCNDVFTLLAKVHKRSSVPQNLFRTWLCPDELKEEVSVMERRKKELELLNVLTWDIDFTSCEVWLEAYILRFDILTNGLFSKNTSSLSWISQRCTDLAKIVNERVSFTMMPPRLLALGLLHTALVQANVLPRRRLERDSPSSCSRTNSYENGASEYPSELQALIVQVVCKSASTDEDELNRSASAVSMLLSRFLNSA